MKEALSINEEFQLIILHDRPNLHLILMRSTINGYLFPTLLPRVYVGSYNKNYPTRNPTQYNKKLQTSQGGGGGGRLCFQEQDTLLLSKFISVGREYFCWCIASVC